jgi:hypothetical protein
VNQAGAPGFGEGADGPTSGAPGDAGDPMEHLWGAAHEFLAAFRAMIDAADAVVLDQQRKAAAPRAPRLRRIDVE